MQQMVCGGKGRRIKERLKESVSCKGSNGECCVGAKSHNNYCEALSNNYYVVQSSCEKLENEASKQRLQFNDSILGANPNHTTNKKEKAK